MEHVGHDHIYVAKKNFYLEEILKMILKKSKATFLKTTRYPCLFWILMD